MPKLGLAFHPGPAGNSPYPFPTRVSRAVITAVIAIGIDGRGSARPTAHRLGLEGYSCLPAGHRVVNAYASLVNIGIVDKCIHRHVPFDERQEAVTGRFFQTERFLERDYL